MTKPPSISNYAKGCEEGQHKGKVHMQGTVEFWDKEGISDQTVRNHLREKLEPVLNSLINLDVGGGRGAHEAPAARPLAPRRCCGEG